MADFSFLSDSDDERTVEDIISQAKDQIVLEQVAAINCSGFTDSFLPTHLETRFQKLKTFPASSTSTPRCCSSSFSPNLHKIGKGEPGTESNSVPDSDENSNCLTPSKSFKGGIFSPPKKNPQVKMPEKSKSQKQTESNSVSDSDEKNGASSPKFFKDEIFSPSKKNPSVRNSKFQKGSSFSSRDYSSSSSSTELSSRSSPPRRSGCFWCSPRKESRSKSSRGKENISGGTRFDWENDEEFLSDLGTFCAKSKKKLLKKAMREEEKVNREAEKIVEWAKQASARIDISGFDFEDDKLGDDVHHMIIGPGLGHAYMGIITRFIKWALLGWVYYILI